MTQILSPLTNLLFAILNFVHETLSVNWGWSIVLLTVIVRIVLIPLTWRQIKSMRALQLLQPQIKELQAKYKGDRQLLQQKTMEFYRENKVSPFGSCLPLLLQMPVFFALFYMLREQNTAAFLRDNAWLWIRDWGSNPSWLAENITKFDLPLLILYVASQFVSSYQMSANQDSTQRTMLLVMPLGIGVVMFLGKWPAGLFIYWLTSNLWTIAQQYVIMKTLPMPAAKAPVAATGGTSVATKQQRKRPTKAKGSKR